MNPADQISIYHNAAQNCYEASVAAQRCVAEYVVTGDRIIFTHTFVPPPLRGRGIAEKIVRFALDDTRARGLKVVPACSYVARWIDRHREYQDLLA